MRKRSFFSKFSLPNLWLEGSGGAYVILILGMVAAASYLITGGLLPDIEKNPVNPEHVQIDDTSVNADRDTLQLINLKPISTPSPTPFGSLSGTPPPGSGTPGIGTPGIGTPGIGTPGIGTPSPGVGTPGIPPPQACLNKTVVDLVIDTSTSMNNSNKLTELQKALGLFVQTLSDGTVVGAQKFGGEEISEDGLQGADSVLDFTQYSGSNKTLISSRLTGITANTGAGTFMRNGFRLALRKISAAQDNTNTYDGYRFVTIVFSDGVPEVSGYSGSQCLAEDTNPYVCFAKDQDPRGLPYGPNSTDYTSQMERRADKVYVVGIYDSTPGARGAGLTDELIALLQTIASGKTTPFYQTIDLKSGSAGDLTDFFNNIYQGICS